MGRQILHRAALFVILAILAEILIVNVVEGSPSNRRKNPPHKKWQNGKKVSGHSAKDINRIVGGTFTTIKEFPYQVAIQKNGRQNCGGTLIGCEQKHVLTAAHCFLDNNIPLNLDDFHLILRSTNILVIESNAIIRRIEKFVKFPDYNVTGGEEHDIAVLTLNEPVEEIMPAKIETFADFNRTDHAGRTAVAVGWGSILGYKGGTKPPPGKSSDRLKRVNLNVMSREDCRKLNLKNNDNEEKVDPTLGGRIICTHNTKVAEGTCQGDSGGPMFVDGVQIGITSNGVGCADKEFPEYYTRVAFYADWIDKQLAATPATP